MLYLHLHSSRWRQHSHSQSASEGDKRITEKYFTGLKIKTGRDGDHVTQDKQKSPKR